MLKKFVLVTGVMDILLGLAVALPMLAMVQSPVFVQIFVLGGFLMFAGAVLTWASADLKNRAPVVFWQGLLRLMAVGAMLAALNAGLAADGSIYYSLVVDSICGPVYLIGVTRLLGISPLQIFLGRTTAPALAPAAA